MTPERVDAMLQGYKSCLGRCGHIEVELSELKRKLRGLQANLAADLASTGGQQYDGMPHGSAVGNPTERAGLKLAAGYISDEMSEIDERIAALEREYSDKIVTVTFVEAWLRGLTSRELWIINKQVFEGLSYKEMIHLYRVDFGEGCSKDLLRRLRKDSLMKIYEMAE